MTNKNTSHFEFALKLGLSGHGATVYISLLSAKIALSPKKIILETNLHRQYVYNALHELIALGLVTAVGKGRVVQYSANSPERVLTKVEEKRITTLESVQRLLELYNQRPMGMIEIIEGPRSVIANEFKSMREQGQNAYLDIIGGAGSRFLDLFQDDFEEYEKLRIEKNCKIRYIGATNDTLHIESSIVASRLNYEGRYLRDITDVINTCIRPDSVTFNIFTPETLSLRIKNREAVASQHALFEVLWNVAHKI